MTEPKQRLPGTTYFVTVACERHEFRLKPSGETNAAFAVAMAEAADRYGVEVIAVCQMSSHYHAVVHDRWGFLSEYLRDFHAVMARYGNARDGVTNCKFWSAQEVDAVALGDVAAVVDKVAYTLANPTKDLIVERPEEWNGVRTAVEAIGSGRGPVFARPKRFFDAAGEVSEAVMLGSELPVEIADAVGVAEFRRRVAARVERYVAEARARVARGEGELLGLARAKRLSVWHASARGEAARERGGVRRRVAAAARGRLQAMLEALVVFRAAHRRAWLRLREGLAAEFPAGTWVAWRYYGAKRAAAGGGTSVPGGLGAPG